MCDPVQVLCQPRFVSTVDCRVTETMLHVAWEPQRAQVEAATLTREE